MQFLLRKSLGQPVGQLFQLPLHGEQRSKDGHHFLEGRPFKIPAYMLLHIAESGIFGENDAAVVRNVFAVENLKQGGFPTAVDTHEADMLTFLHFKGDMLQNRFFSKA